MKKKGARLAALAGVLVLALTQTALAGEISYNNTTYNETGSILPQTGSASTADLYEEETDSSGRPSGGMAESEEENESETAVTETETRTESESDRTGETESESETEEIVIDPDEEPEEPEEIVITPDYLTEAEFEAVSERIRIATEVPIEGLPSYITQEMVSAALQCQEETGCPASVTLAQLILESRNEDGSGMRTLAAKYCNLFGLHGVGSNGYAGSGEDSVADEMMNYPTTRTFAAYYTYTEAFHDRNSILQGQAYVSIRTSDADEYAVLFGQQWAGCTDYGLRLIDIMRTYDLYRVDELTLDEFSDLIGNIANPCPGSHITSTFGYRAWDAKNHLGLDLATNSQHIPTYAAMAGTVIYVGYGTSTGNMIVINHGNGIITKYMHHSEMYVEVGDTVFKGQQIGLTGTTGHSTGIHLHFQVEVGGSPVDPLLYFSKMGSTGTIAWQETAYEGLPVSSDLPVAAVSDLDTIVNSCFSLKRFEGGQP